MIKIRYILVLIVWLQDEIYIIHCTLMMMMIMMMIIVMMTVMMIMMVLKMVTGNIDSDDHKSYSKRYHKAVISELIEEGGECKRSSEER